MSSDCCCCWFECLRKGSIIVNDNAINHSMPKRRLLPVVDNEIPTLRPYSCFRLKRIKKKLSNINNKNDHHHNHQRRNHQCHHQKHFQENNDSHNHYDVAPQMPKRIVSQESLIDFEFINSNNYNNITIHDIDRKSVV